MLPAAAEAKLEVNGEGMIVVSKCNGWTTRSQNATNQASSVDEGLGGEFEDPVVVGEGLSRGGSSLQ